LPTVDIDGIATHYEVSGSGPPILMMAPGGFDSAIEKWSTTWPWQHFLPRQTLARDYTCMAYDRREAGRSGGRVEQLTWAAYADQAKGLLDHLGMASAFIMGSCLGCSPVIAFWDVHLESPPPDHIRDRILDFLAAHAGAGVHA
jgi:pimeloyl-ACP methyl ester carboxylesterase